MSEIHRSFPQPIKNLSRENFLEAGNNYNRKAMTQGVVDAFATALKNLNEDDRELIKMVHDSDVSTQDLVEELLSKERREKTRELVDDVFGELTESERRNVTDIVVNTARKMRTGEFNPREDAPEVLKGLITNSTSKLGTKMVQICLDNLDQATNSTVKLDLDQITELTTDSTVKLDLDQKTELTTDSTVELNLDQKTELTTVKLDLDSNQTED